MRRRPRRAAAESPSRLARVPLEILLLSLASCNAGSDPAPPAAEPRGDATPPAGGKSRAAAVLRGTGGYEAVDVPDPGTLEVLAVYAGDPLPEPAEVPVALVGSGCARKVLTENLLVDRATRGLRNVVVRLEGISRGKAGPEKILVEVKDCAFRPHVSAAMRGTRLETRTADAVDHTAHARLHGESLFNIPLVPGGEAPAPRPLPQAGIVDLSCDLHAFMRGFIAVHTNPYVTITDERGRAALDGIPPGRHAFTAWHEELGEKRGEVEVSAGGRARLELEFAAPR